MIPSQPLYCPVSWAKCKFNRRKVHQNQFSANVSGGTLRNSSLQDLMRKRENFLFLSHNNKVWIVLNYDRRGRERQQKQHWAWWKVLSSAWWVVCMWQRTVLCYHDYPVHSAWRSVPRRMEPGRAVWLFLLSLASRAARKTFPCKNVSPCFRGTVIIKTEREKETGEREQEKSLITCKGKLFSFMPNPFRSSVGPWRVEGGGLPAPRT